MSLQTWIVVAAGACFVAKLIWNKYPLTSVGGILLCVALLIGRS